MTLRDCIVFYVLDCQCIYYSGMVLFFFFQAEDGIRDLVRSRGLGDVYKRQSLDGPGHGEGPPHRDRIPQRVCGARGRKGRRLLPVSYTHLTLPTSDLV